MTPEAILAEKKAIKNERALEKERVKKETQLLTERKTKAAAEYRKNKGKRKKDNEKRDLKRHKDSKKAANIYARFYKKHFDNRARIASDRFNTNMTLALGKNFREKNRLTDEEKEEWTLFYKHAAKGKDDDLKTIVEDMETVKEMKTLMYIPPHWISELRLSLIHI